MTTSDVPSVAQFSLSGKVALVTGAAGGLGRAMALALAGAGADMALVDRDAAGLERVAAEAQAAGRQCLIIAADLGRPAEARRMVEETVARFGKLSIAVNAAGVNRRKPALEFTEDDWDFIIGVNLKGVFFCCQEEGRVMTAQGYGRIINISSLTSEVALSRRAIYAASKAGVTGMTRVFAGEWARYGVTVNCIGPGHMLTPMTASMFADPNVAGPVTARIPQGRLGLPADLAGAVVYLASDAAAYVTGQTIYVDGGYLLNFV
jgi:2-deoxy-D-gluconate 3-dehydrogenase